MQIRETLKEANCELVALTSQKDEIILRDNELQEFQVWQKRDDHSGYTIEVNGVGYKMVRLATATDIQLCLPFVSVAGREVSLPQSPCLPFVGEGPQSEHWHEDFELENRKRMSQENQTT